MGIFPKTAEKAALSPLFAEQYLYVCSIPFPLLAGEQNDLTFFCHVFQNGQRRLHPRIVEAHQRVVQNQGGLRGQLLRHGQTEGEVQLVDGAVAAPQGVVEGLLLG